MIRIHRQTTIDEIEVARRTKMPIRCNDKTPPRRIIADTEGVSQALMPLSSGDEVETTQSNLSRRRIVQADSNVPQIRLKRRLESGNVVRRNHACYLFPRIRESMAEQTITRAQCSGETSCAHRVDMQLRTPSTSLMMG
jgi:hypothetical protein